MHQVEKEGSSVRWFRRGMRDGIPISAGYFAVAFALGITAKQMGLSVLQSAVMSLTMLASAGEFAAITVIGGNAGLLIMAVTTVVVNMRYLLMSTALSQKIDSRTGLVKRLMMSYCVTDEIFALAVTVKGKLDPMYNAGMAVVAAPGWTAGTALGAALGSVLPTAAANALGVALYGMFLAVIIPPARKNLVIAAVVIVSMLSSWLMSVLPLLREISSGTRIIILTLLIASAAAILRPVKEEEGGQPS